MSNITYQETHKWEVEVNQPPYFQSFIQGIGGVIGFSYEDDSHGLMNTMYSLHLDAIDEPEVVKSRIASFELLVNGSMRLSGESHDRMPLTFTRFMNTKTGKIYDMGATDIEENPFETDLPFAALLDNSSNNKSTSSKLLNLAKDHEPIRTLLFMAGLIKTTDTQDRILAWSILYKMLETVKYFSRENSINFEDKYDYRDVQAFTTACNLRSVLGIYARHGHGKPGKKAPTNVLTDLDEAIDFIFSIANQFCKDYRQTKML